MITTEPIDGVTSLKGKGVTRGHITDCLSGGMMDTS